MADLYVLSRQTKRSNPLEEQWDDAGWGWCITLIRYFGEQDRLDPWKTTVMRILNCLRAWRRKPMTFIKHKGRDLNLPGPVLRKDWRGKTTFIYRHVKQIVIRADLNDFSFHEEQNLNFGQNDAQARDVWSDELMQRINVDFNEEIVVYSLQNDSISGKQLTV